MIPLEQVKLIRIQAGTPAPEKTTVMRESKPEIQLSVCEKNYHCVAWCPRDAISINAKGSPVIRNDLCDGCFICLRECPSAAIREAAP